MGVNPEVHKNHAAINTLTMTNKKDNMLYGKAKKP
jgi:hypothetical protein